MTPFHLAIGMTQAMSQPWIEAQSKWLETVSSATKGVNGTSHSPNGAARSWYRPPAPTWPEVLQSYGWPAPVAQMAAFWPQPTTNAANPFTAFWTNAMPSFAGPSGKTAAADPLSAALSMQLHLLQAAVQPLQAMSAMMPGSTASTKRSNAVAEQSAASAKTIPLNWMPSFASEAKSDCAVASITLPDQTTFKLTVPMGPAAVAPFWPWAGPFGASGHASPPTAIDGTSSTTECKATTGDNRDDAMSAEKALSESMRRTYMRSSRN